MGSIAIILARKTHIFGTVILLSMQRMVALAGCLLLASPAYPWWETGHRAVARIAALHLTPAAQARVAQLLGVTNTPDAVADALAISSTWADDTKAQTKTGSWH